MCMCVAAIARWGGNIRGVHGGKVAARPQERSFVLAEKNMDLTRRRGGRGERGIPFLLSASSASPREAFDGRTHAEEQRSGGRPGATPLLPLLLCCLCVSAFTGAEGREEGRGVRPLRKKESRF